MSQQLADYIAARHEVIVSVLEMLTAEYQLSDERSSVLDLAGAEREMDVAAGRLTEAVEALERDRKPVGWGKPPKVAGNLTAPRQGLVRAVLRVLEAEVDGEGADAAAEAEYADEQLCLAARDLAADVAAHAERAKVAAPSSLPLEWPADSEGAR